jgi:hypothetical protein
MSVEQSKNRNTSVGRLQKFRRIRIEKADANMVVPLVRCSNVLSKVPKYTPVAGKIRLQQPTSSTAGLVVRN